MSPTLAFIAWAAPWAILLVLASLTVLALRWLDYRLFPEDGSEVERDG